MDCTNLQTLKKDKLNYPLNPLIGNLNINSIRSKISDIREVFGKLQLNYFVLKPGSHLPKKILFIFFNERSLKVMKNAFYFILKVLFVLKIFTFLS